MAKALKPLVVILLLISIAALCVQAFLLFPKRTLIKDRTQRLESGVERIVNTLRREIPEDIFRQANFRVANFQVDSPENLASIDREFTKINTLAESVLTDLVNTRQDLETTRQDLERTRLELEQTRAELDQANNEIVRLNDVIRTKDAELATANRRIASLEDEKSSLEVQVSDLNDTVAQQEDAIRQLEEDKAMLDAQLAKLIAETMDGPMDIPAGLTGQIIYSNPEWNFVVLDIGSVQGLKPTAEMIVHRGDAMLGKIKVTEVKDNISIAEILLDWRKGSVQEGDDVLY